MPMYRSIPVYPCLFGFFLNLHAPEGLLVAPDEPHRCASTGSTKINQCLLDRAILQKYMPIGP